MKPLLPYLVTLLLSVLFIAMDSPHFSSHKEIRVVEFTGDSGYLMKPEVINILKKIISTDTIDQDWFDFDYHAWDSISATDKLGKFYRHTSGNIYASLCIPSVPAFIIVEITPEGKVINNETFGGGAHMCCIDNLQNTFRKKGNYYIVQTCATGSAFCASYIYAFKQLKPQDEQNGIDEYVYSGFCGNENTTCELTSAMDVKGDSIIMHYTSKKGKIKKNGDFKVKKTEKFDIYYTKKDSVWIASDSTKLESYLY